MELLAPYWVADTNGYEDLISKAARKDRRVSKLIQREALIASFRVGHNDELVVASLACLVFDDRDLITVAGAADQAGATIVDLNSGLRIAPKMRVWKLRDARDAMEVARRGDITKSATERARELRLDWTRQRADRIREDWGNPAFTTKELLARAGDKGSPMAYSIAVREMGNLTRPDAIKEWEGKQNQRNALLKYHAERAARKAAKGAKK